MRRILLIFLGFLVVLALAGVLLLQTRGAKEFARAKIVDALEARGLETQLSSVGYSLIGPSVTLNDVTVRAAAARDLPPVVKAKRMSLNISMLALLAGRYVLDEAVLDNPEFHVVVSENGATNIPKLPGDRNGGRETAIDNFRASGGSLIYEDRQRKLAARLPEWRLTFDGDRNAMEADIDLETRRPGVVQYAGREMPVDSLAIDARVRSDGAELRSLKLASTGSQIEASGSVKNYSNPELNLKGRANLDLAPLTRFAGYAEPLKGIVKGPFTAAGTIDVLRVGADLAGDGLSIKGFERLDLKTQGVYERAARRLRLDSVSFNAPAANAVASGVIAFAEGSQSAIDARVNNADLQTLSAARKMGVTIASKAAGTVNLHWPDLRAARASAGANLNLTATRPEPAANVLPVSGPLAIAYGGGQVTASSDALRVLATQAGARVTVTPSGTLQGNVSGRADDAERLLAHLRAFLGRDKPLLPVKVSGETRFTAGLGGTAQHPNIDLNVSAPALDVGRLENSRFTADALYSPERLLIERAELRWLGQTLVIEGAMGLGGASPTLDLNAKADGAAVAALIGGLGRLANLPVRSGISVRAHIGGTLAEPRTTVDATGIELPGAIGSLLKK